MRTSEDAASADIHFGGCLCGAVRFRLRGPLRAVVNCHCGQCRKFHGHYGAYTAVREDRISYLSDSDLRWFASSSGAERGFCGNCGSSLFWKPQGQGKLSVSAGSLDQPTGLATAGDIFVADRGDYYSIEGSRPARLQGGGDKLVQELAAEDRV